MGKFIINKGDYIDSREFSREECERFCELAVECGYNDRYADFSGVWVLHGVSSGGELISCHDGDSVCRNNITTQFREFLNKEKGVNKPSWDGAPEWATELRRNDCGDYRFLGNGKVTYKDGSHHQNNMGNEIWGDLIETRPKQFTKADLKDGMRAELDTTDLVLYVCGDKLAAPFPFGNHWGEIDALDDNLQSVETGSKVIRVTDRDGTVLFEREEEPRELTIDEIAKAFNLPVERVRIKK